jgi:triacylglycerol lipase
MEDAEALSAHRPAARSAVELSRADGAPAAAPGATAEHVVLLHGILRTPRQMRPLQQRLEEAGYVVHNLGYPSTKLDLAAIVEHVHASLSQPAVAAGLASGPRVHFVGYSLGGLVARAYLKSHRPARLGRVVLLATPNHGSEVADALKPLPPYHWIAGPVGQELGTDRSAIEALFSPVDYEVGVLAGDVSLDPLGSLVLPRPHDGKVSVESTRLPGMADHRVLHASHTFFPANERVIEETLAFLREGRFSPAA